MKTAAIGEHAEILKVEGSPSIHATVPNTAGQEMLESWVHFLPAKLNTESEGCTVPSSKTRMPSHECPSLMITFPVW